MAGHDIIVVGASAGGVEALSRLAAGLPANLPAAIFVVHHFPPRSTSVLPSILNRAGPLPASNPSNLEEIQNSHIYIAPPDYHMLIRHGRIVVAHGPRENGHRPAIDPLFRTAARSYGRRVIGVILTGTLDDGTAGLFAVKARGGIAVVQDPEDALYAGMPRSAIENVEVDEILPLEAIGSALARLAATDMVGEEEHELDDSDVDIAEGGTVHLAQNTYPGNPSVYTCPDCGGALWEMREGEVVRFRCHVGHGYNAEALLSAQGDNLESALWAAARALEENSALAHRLAVRAREAGNDISAARFERQQEDAERRADMIRSVLSNGSLAGMIEPGHERSSGRAT